MKNSIDNIFKEAKKQNRPALISYTVCGDNNKENSLNILNSISENIDIAEWGLLMVSFMMVKIQNSSYSSN